MCTMASMVTAPRSRNARQRGFLGRILVHVIVLLICFLTIFPFFWMFSTSFKLADSIPAAFAFARLKFRGRAFFFAVVLATMIVPGVTHIVPNYILVSDLGWLDTWAGVVIPSLPATAFYMFLLRQNILTLPQDLIDAGRLDGASTVKLLWQIVIPNIRPAIAVVSILSFLGAWNQYLWPLLVLNDFESKTLAVGMQFFTSNTESAQLWGPMMAAVAIIGPQSCADSVFDVKNCMPTASVFDSKSFNTNNGHRYWFHAPRKDRMLTTAMAGRIFGMTTVSYTHLRAHET